MFNCRVSRYVIILATVSFSIMQVQSEICFEKRQLFMYVEKIRLEFTALFTLPIYYSVSVNISFFFFIIFIIILLDAKEKFETFSTKISYTYLYILLYFVLIAIHRQRK